MKPKHVRKMIAPIIISVLIVLYYVGFAAFCILIPDFPIFLKIIIGAVKIK